jgi:amidase
MHEIKTHNLMTTHHFVPTQYYNTFGSHPSVLRLNPGDTLVTTTVDAHGIDARGEQVMDGSNPQTGPFYIEGAQPGDTLKVHLDHLAPNRETGWSYSVVAPHIVDADRVRGLPESEKVDWQFRPDGGARIQTPALGKLNRIDFALQPMLGCIGVAPAGGQAITSATSGPYGGNMDYRGVSAGATLYFPVFVPGALFHFGDGHALQGDGEVVGTGIETSFAVQCTLELIKGRRISWPRGENDDEIFTIGNARPLEQALQHATTEMLAWLEQDYGLEAAAASTLLGMCVRYDLGNIYDPAYTMVCKLPKAMLR